VQNKFIEIFGNLGNYVLRQSPKKVLIVGISIFYIKTGMRGILPWASFDSVNNFPKIEESFSTYSIGLLSLANLTRANTEIRYFILNLALLIFLSIIFLLRLSRHLNSNMSAVLLFLLCLNSPVGVVLAGNIGRHDLLTIFGYIIFFVESKSKLKYVGVIIGLLGSPEHFIVGWVFALILSLALGDKEQIKLSRQALFSSITFFIPIFIFVFIQTNSNNRISNIVTEFEYMQIGIRNWVFSGSLEVYSYFGIFLPVFLVFCVYFYSVEKKKGLSVALIFFIPTVLNVFIVDKTRDYVIALLASAVILIRYQLQNSDFHQFVSSDLLRKQIMVGYFLIFILLFPSLEITFEGVPRSPHFWTFSKLIEFCHGSTSIC